MRDVPLSQAQKWAVEAMLQAAYFVKNNKPTGTFKEFREAVGKRFRSNLLSKRTIIPQYNDIDFSKFIDEISNRIDKLGISTQLEYLNAFTNAHNSYFRGE